jgi:REP element-mobilizing transposase RayT
MGRRRTTHAVFDIKHYLVWIPKYRKLLLMGEIAQYANEVLQREAEKYGF